jgi:hypothetical protein
VIKELIKLATHLDDKGCYKEAGYVDAIIKRAGPIDNKKLVLSHLSGFKKPEDRLSVFEQFLEYALRETRAFSWSHDIRDSDEETLRWIRSNFTQPPASDLEGVNEYIRSRMAAERSGSEHRGEAALYDLFAKWIWGEGSEEDLYEDDPSDEQELEWHMYSDAP